MRFGGHASRGVRIILSLLNRRPLSGFDTEQLSASAWLWSREYPGVGRVSHLIFQWNPMAEAPRDMA